MPKTCPAYDIWDGHILRCILPAGHDGDHLGDKFEPTERGQG